MKLFAKVVRRRIGAALRTYIPMNGGYEVKVHISFLGVSIDAMSKGKLKGIL